MEDSEVTKKATGILEDLLNLLKIEAKTKVSMEVDSEDQKFLKIAIEGDDLGKLIGYQGNTLNALQLIFAQMLFNQIGEVITVLVDVNDYRQRRESYLKSLALRASEEAKENKQNVELPPLSPFERRVIHMALKSEEGVTTESSGEGEERHVVVKVES